MNTDIYRVCKKGRGRTLTTRSARQTKQKDILGVIISCKDFYSSLFFFFFFFFCLFVFLCIKFLYNQREACRKELISTPIKKS